MILNDEQIEEIKKANEARTQGEWGSKFEVVTYPASVYGEAESIASVTILLEEHAGDECLFFGTSPTTEADGEFVANAPEYVTNLLETVEALQAERANARGVLTKIKSWLQVANDAPYPKPAQISVSLRNIDALLEGS